MTLAASDLTAPLETERKIGGRIIRKGDVVKITGYPYARVRTFINGRIVQVKGFRVLGFRGGEVHVWGARTSTKAELLRVFTVGQIGVRPRRPKT